MARSDLHLLSSHQSSYSYDLDVPQQKLAGSKVRIAAGIAGIGLCCVLAVSGVFSATKGQASLLTTSTVARPTAATASQGVNQKVPTSLPMAAPRVLGQPPRSMAGVEQGRTATVKATHEASGVQAESVYRTEDTFQEESSTSSTGLWFLPVVLAAIGSFLAYAFLKKDSPRVAMMATSAAGPESHAFSGVSISGENKEVRDVKMADSLNQGGRESRPSVAEGARLITAVKTPFMPNGRFDLGAYEEHLARQAAAGVEGVIVGGTTGEGHIMSWDEHVMLIASTVQQFGDKLKIVGNTGSNSTREALHASEQGFAVGMHAALHINPYYGKTSEAGLNRHFNAVLNEGPSIIYNVPSRTGQDIPDSVILGLKDHPNFLGVKECTGNERIKAYAEEGIKCWSGNDDECHEARHLFNGHGVISVASNLIPGVWAKLMGPEPDFELAKKVGPFVEWLFSEPNPIPLNTAMAMCGLCKPVFRAPYMPMSKEQRIKGQKLLQDLIEYIPGCTEVRVLEDEDFIVVDGY